MKALILISDKTHPVNSYLKDFVDQNAEHHEIKVIHQRDEIVSADVLFLISCHELVRDEELALVEHALVLHASDLPTGRGWSPHIWQVLEQKEQITISMLEARQKVDTGDIWAQGVIDIPNTALFDEINRRVFAAEIRLMQHFLDHYHELHPWPQRLDIAPTYYRRRTPSDSELDPTQTLAQQFDLLRVSDPDRYPAYFILRGAKYRIKIERDE